MHKETITYDDYNGVERTEDFYFNLTNAEIVEMELGTEGGLAEKLERVVAAKDGPTIINFFKDLVLRSYGVKSDDGRRFMKSDEIRASFAETEAYSQIFMKFATDAEAASAFVNQVLPSKKEAPLAQSAT
jgi:hypothetical protein